MSIAPSVRFRPYTRKRAQVAVRSPDHSTPAPDTSQLLVPYFEDNGSKHILIKDLASLWNFPSSYQVIAHLSRHSGVAKSELVKKTNPELNEKLFKMELIVESDLRTTLFYVEVVVLASILTDSNTLFGPFELDEFPVAMDQDPPSDKAMPNVTVIFPDIGEVEKSVALNHGSFLALNPLTKFQVYKNVGSYRRVFGSNLTPAERELLMRENNYSAFEFSIEGPESSSDPAKQDSKKNIGRQKRTSNLDPNQLDVTENILPGCGLIPKFSVAAVCKVPNYFATTNLMGITQQNAYYNAGDRHLKNLKLRFSDSGSALKLISLLMPNGDQDPFLYKYYYYKHYRGPGTGVYKDGALSSKMNKIQTVESARALHLPSYRVMKNQPVERRSIRGLVYPQYTKDNLEVTVQRQRAFTEDFCNMEMLHNNCTFNILVNSYREVANETWALFYKFKMVDFEKLYLIHNVEQRAKIRAELIARQHKLQQASEVKLPTPPELAERLQPDLSERFTVPTQYPEIVQRLPMNLRENRLDPQTYISRPIRYAARTMDRGTPELLNQIEVLKLPNANALGWDNLRKYRYVT